jgi:CrcB protein
MLKLALIFLGAGLGGVLRYLLGSAIQTAWDTPFPVGTLAVNSLGCLAIGFLAAALTGPTWGDERLRAALIIGFLGGFTTFSAFGFETYRLLEGRHLALAAANILLSNTLTLAGVWLGARLAARLQS